MTSIAFIPPRLERLDELRGGLLVLFRYNARRPLQGVHGLVDWRLLGHLSRMVIDGFINGNKDESTLVPLAERLPQRHLLIFGLGSLEEFDVRLFDLALERMFSAADKILPEAPITVCLPGRNDDSFSSAEAIDRFLMAYDEWGKGRHVTLIEEHGAQKAMLPSVERWRLKKSVPPDNGN